MPAAVDLCLAADVAADLGVASDATVQRCVTVASRAVAAFCGRAFERATLTEYPVCYAHPLLLLERSPIVSIASITERGGLLSASSYALDPRYAEAGMVLRKGANWPAVVRTGGFTSETVTHHLPDPETLTVVYVAGYVTPGQKALGEVLPVDLPEDVQEATILEACALYRGRGRDADVASEALGDWSASYRERKPGQQLASERAAALLAPHVRLKVA